VLVTNIETMAGATTRRRLQESALRLFTERGFDEVTVDEIARDAGVSHMTFFRNFPTKEAVIMDDPYDPVIGLAVAAQARDLPPLERAGRGILDAWEALAPPEATETRQRLMLAAGHPALRAKVWENNMRTEDVIVAALTDTGVPAFEARVAAGAVNGALTAALFDWAHDVSGSTLGQRISDALALLAPLGAET